ncbi:1286_t:CDS:2, partial [Ambispora gerdemannii]
PTANARYHLRRRSTAQSRGSGNGRDGDLMRRTRETTVRTVILGAGIHNTNINAIDNVDTDINMVDDVDTDMVDDVNTGVETTDINVVDDVEITMEKLRWRNYDG